MEGRTHDLYMRYYPSICLEGPSKITKNLIQDSQLLSRPRLEPLTGHKSEAKLLGL
jgi:hypothetical protein